MSIAANAIAIGLTGPFGSGCTTTAGILVAQRGYVHARLSEEIRARWEVTDGPPPTRAELQRLGNQLREGANAGGHLAHKAIERLESLPEVCGLIAFDGIRNIGEIEVLRERFGRRFHLLAVHCKPSDRWQRLEHTEYSGKTLTEFSADDQRDKNEEYEFGQQVQLCVDAADLLLNNDNQVTQTGLATKALDLVDVATGARPRYADPHEILMNLAYSASHGSKCLKRQVGAVLVAAPPWTMGDVIGQGFNENPLPTLPCVLEPEYGANADTNTRGQCYRDMVRAAAFRQLVEQQKRCPNCGNPIQGPIGDQPPWRCRSCSEDLETYFWPERAMQYCTAVHAEVAAMMAAGIRARDATLYTTTLPCFQCTEKIIQAGIKAIIYTEPYPDVQAGQRLRIGGVDIYQFEGVRSGGFDEIFARARDHMNRPRDS